MDTKDKIINPHDKLFKDIFSKEKKTRESYSLSQVYHQCHYKITEQDIQDILIKTLPQGGDKIMATLAEEWIEQGIRQGMEKGMQMGIQKGMQQGLLEGIHLGLKLNFGINAFTLYPDISKIEDIAQLQAIKEAILIVKDIEEIKELINEMANNCDSIR